jgi:hypothetical protein
MNEETQLLWDRKQAIVAWQISHLQLLSQMWLTMEKLHHLRMMSKVDGFKVELHEGNMW